jgi:RNA polymerase sigma-70 factor (ECF subfamily)
MSIQTPTTEPGDELLVQAVRAGDPEAMFELDRRWRQRLLEVALSILHDEDSAQDAAQLALWRAYLNVDRYDSSRPFGPWISAIARNCARDYLRRQRNRPTLGNAEMLEQTADPSAPETNPVARREELDALRACIDELSERSRTVIALSVTGFSLNEIGRTLDRPKNTVQSWLEQARAQLRRCLAAKGFAHEE